MFIFLVGSWYIYMIRLSSIFYPLSLPSPLTHPLSPLSSFLEMFAVHHIYIICVELVYFKNIICPDFVISPCILKNILFYLLCNSLQPCSVLIPKILALCVVESSCIQYSGTSNTLCDRGRDRWAILYCRQKIRPTICWYSHTQILSSAH